MISELLAGGFRLLRKGCKEMQHPVELIRDENLRTKDTELCGLLPGYPRLSSWPWFDGQGRLLAAIETIQDITPLKSAEEKNTKLAAQLSEAFDRIKILNGFLPICATCKKIRGSEGQWQQIEDYIRDHSEARFTHGICADCASQVYADLKLLKKK